MSIQHMQTVFDAGDLTAPQKAVLLAYCNFTDPHGYCWPGVERIADMTGLSVSGVKKIRKQLIEDKLLTTVSRGKKGGGRKTNGSRINVKRLQKMKLPPREYDDNLMPELGFEEDDEPEASEAKVPEGHTNGSPGAPQRYLGGTNVGTSGGPYPSVDPSVEPSGDPSSSSAEVEDVTHEAAAPAVEKKRKTISERDEAERIVGERLPDSTPEERTVVVDAVIAEATRNGKRITFIDRWIKGRPQLALEQDLAHIRRHSAPPTADTCGLHSVSLASGTCHACMGDITGGDTTAVEAHLAEVGAEARPDLARRLGAPQAARVLDEGERIRRMQKGAYRPYRNPQDQSEYDAPLLPSPRPQDLTGALAPVVTAEQIRSGDVELRV